jgi:hypothetical protein
MNWTPAALLPNITSKKAIECDVIGIAPSDDQRVADFSRAHPRFKELLSRFTNSFNVPLEPMVLIVRDDVLPKLAKVEPLASFRDLVAVSVIPYTRSLSMVYNGIPRISYSNSFWFHPWMLATDNEHLYANTPAMTAFHVVDEFHGQSSPELSRMEVEDFDLMLFKAMVSCWKRHYLSTRQTWRDRALFRSLNMAAQAAQLPGGIDTTLHDLGRQVSLWVSAFEILAHPRTSGSGLRAVYPLFEKVSYRNSAVGHRRYAAYMNQQKPWPRRSLPCWLYGKLYLARCAFLHGNPVQITLLNHRVFWLAPSLYRLALTGFLNLPANDTATAGYAEYKINQVQPIVERALLRR